MYEQTSPLYAPRLFISSAVITTLFLLCAAFIAAVGNGTLLDTQAHPSIAEQTTPRAISSPNAVTNAAYSLIDGSRYVALSTGRAIHSTSRAITVTTVSAGRSVAHATATSAQATWRGIATVGRGIGEGVLFTIGLPGKAVASVTQAPAVDNFMRPANNAEVPVIDSAAAAQIIADHNAQQQQELAKLEAAQLTANHGLGGSVIAGNPSRGGYPAKWDNARKDAMIDDWGMYNRECVSYAAWKVHQTFGNMPYWGGVGNANQWVANARRAGIPTSKVPRVQSVAISMSGYYGHAMWVEKVSGNMIYVSQYNYDLDGRYSEMWVDGSDLTYIYF